MFRIGICEDEDFLLYALETYINDYVRDNKIDAKIVVAANGYHEMLKFIETNEADLYLMDIRIESDDIEKNGYTLAKKIRETDSDAAIVFITADSRYMKRSFDVKARFFIEKPFSCEAIEKVIYQTHYEFECSKDLKKEKTIVIESGKTIYRIQLDDILFLEKENLITKIHTINSIITCRNSLSNLEKMINDERFIKTHKSFICNIEQISEIDQNTNEIKMKPGAVCLLGRTFKNNLMEKILNGSK